MWCERICLFQVWLFGEDDGCESGDRGCGWGGGVGIVKVVSGVEISVGGGGASNREDSVVSSGGDVGVDGGSWMEGML